MMHIQVVTPSLSKKSGGVGIAVLNTYSHFSELFCDDNVEILSLHPYDDDSSRAERLKLTWFHRSLLSQLGYSKDLIAYARNIAPDVVHTHGIWMATSAYQNKLSVLYNTPAIISPHGMLDPWILSRGYHKKIVARLLYENKAWKSCRFFHALNNREADAIRSVIPKADIEVIPNGVDVPHEYVEKSYSVVRKILFLGRFHPKKNVHSIVEAVSLIDCNEYNRRPFVLQLAGWGDESYISELRGRIAETYPERFEWIGPVFGEAKKDIFNNAHAFLLPSFSEGLPVAILEAWASGLIPLMSENCNLNEAFSESVAINTGVTPDSIRASIREFMEMSDSEVRDVSLAGYGYVRKLYNWSVVCSAYKELYEEACS